MNEYEVVKRPERTGKSARPGIMAALRETLRTGAAVRVKTNNRAYFSGYSYRLKLEGLRVATKADGAFVIGWCERVASNGAPASAEQPHREDAS